MPTGADRAWAFGANSRRRCGFAEQMNNHSAAVLLVDIGNTHTHLGLLDGEVIEPLGELKTVGWAKESSVEELKNLAPGAIAGISLCSVVPRATPLFLNVARSLWPAARVFELNHLTV